MTAFDITPKARPGSLFKTGKTAKRAPKRAAAPDHLAYIRELPSLVPGTGGVEAAHVRYGDRLHGKPQTGIGVKPDDTFVLPLAHSAHMAQHNHGDERDWWRSWGLEDPLVVCHRLWMVSGDVEAGIQIIRETMEVMRTNLQHREKA